MRLFGTHIANRDQFNLVYFRQTEKDTNSELNTFDDRHQNIVIANYYRQDFIFPGYTAQVSVHYNHDEPSIQVRQATASWCGPIRSASFSRTRSTSVYLGWAGDGHINRFNITHAFYWVARPRQPQPARQPAPGHQRPDGRAGTVLRPRLGSLPHVVLLGLRRRQHRTTRTPPASTRILDNPNFAGGEFSYWQRQAIRLFGVNLTNRAEPGARPAFEQDPGPEQLRQPRPAAGQPRRRRRRDAEAAADQQRQLPLVRQDRRRWSTFTFQQNIRQFIGTDLSIGFEYRPLLSNNVIMKFGVATLVPGAGFRDLYDHLNGHVPPLGMAFAEITLTF